MKFKTFLFGVLTLSFLPLLTLSGYASERKPLIVVGDANFPPVEYIENGRVKGFNTEIWQELSKAMNRPVKIRLMLWKDAQQKVLNGEADALTLLGRTKEREKLYDFSEPTLNFEFCFFTRSDDVPFETIKDFEGRTIGVTKGGYAREVLKSHENIKLLFIKNNLEGFQLLTSGKIDAVGTDKWVGAFAIQKHQIKGINIVEKPFAKSLASITVKKGNLKLLNEINSGIKKLKKDKAIQKILDKWSPKEVVFLTKERIKRIIITGVTAFLIAVIVFSLLWIVLLKQQVNRKTGQLRQEIGERKKIEKQLQEKQKELDIIFNSVPALVWSKNNKGKYVQVNRAYCETVGLSKEKIIGRTDYDLYPADIADQYSKYDQKIIDSKKPVLGIEERHLKPSGDYGWSLTEKLPYYDAESDTVGTIGFAIDITSRKQAEEALRESEERFRTFIDFTYDWEFWITPDGHHVYVSPSCERITGYSPEEFMTDPGLLEKIVHPDDHSTVVNHLREEQNPEELSPIDFRIITRSGEERWLNHVCQPVCGIDGMHLGRRGGNRDITKRKQMEEELLKAKKLESLGVLAGGIAHQFNNALSSITGHAGLLEMEYPQDEKITDYAEAMKQSAHRMAHLTSQLLAYAGGGKYDPQPMSPSELIESALSLIQHTLDPDIRLKTDLPPEVLNVKVDRTQMQMVLSAIIANSNEAIEGSGRIKISTRNMEVDQGSIKVHPGLKPGYYVCLSIEDNGKGMDEETKERIFEPFFTTNFIGRGMGMASVYGIVTNHDGMVSVDSEPGKGTAVTIYLPAISAGSKEQGAKVVTEPAVEVPMGEGTILVIEDEETLVELFRQILERLGYHVLQARNGEEAVEIAKTFEGRIDLALLDIKLPDMDGGRVYPLIMEARPNLKVIVCSGYSIDGPAQAILDAGAEGFIQKPFLILPFAEKLKEVLEGK